MQDHLCDVQLQLPGHLLVSARGGAGCLPHQGHQHTATGASRLTFMPYKPKLTVKMEMALSKFLSFRNLLETPWNDVNNILAKKISLSKSF